MGSRELAEALRAAAEERAAAIRRGAEADCGRIRSEAADAVAALREEYGRREAAAVEAAKGEIRAAAEQTVRLAGLRAEHLLAERLHRLARELLPGVGAEGGEALFASLGRELPPGDWERVTVNPADEAPARRLFPGAAIAADPAVFGGLEAERGGGRFRVVNTLEKRLERGWAELLPALLAEIRGGG
ncbi:hypothetical protein [Geobacter sp.]|uniref:hypothetical protein n=1 Tax=Geobacter sp. TaxID=46610 RepID=UPI00260B5B7E|nr:hypothetical protein [Geobacter sp.]